MRLPLPERHALAADAEIHDRHEDCDLAHTQRQDTLIGSREIIRRVATKASAKVFTPRIRALASDVQTGLGQQLGGAKMYMAMLVMLRKRGT